MFLFRLAPEGLPYVIATALLALATYFLGMPWFALVLMVIFFYMEIFFRDPKRVIPQGKDIFVSPADGKIIRIRTVREDEYIQGEAKQISIFMSVFNVHVNRAPCDGRVEIVKHTSGGFRAAYKDEASERNENIAMVLNTEYGKVLVRQVAGLLARRAVCRVKPGESLKRGQKYGIIKFGSRVDIYLPVDAQIQAMNGQKVKAGETVLAYMESKLSDSHVV